MYKNVKVVAAIAVAGFAVGAAAAAEKMPAVTVGGVIDTQGAFVKQTTKYGYEGANVASSKLQKTGITTSGKVNLGVEGKAHGVTYGGLVALNANTSKRDLVFSRTNDDYKYPVASQTMVFVESAFGRLEGGSYTGAYDAMKSGYIARATGGVSGDWLKYPSISLKDASGAGVTGNLIFTPSLPTSSDSVVTANASKINYYTPSFAGLKAGVTFIPDAARSGTTSTIKSLGEELSQRNTYKNVVQGGIMYHAAFNKMDVKASVLGEAGSAKKLISGANTTKRKDLRAWEAGLSLHYMGFGIGGTYGDWGKSGLNKNVSNGTTTTAYTGAKNGRYWSASAGYEHSHYGVSFGYFNSKNGGFNLASNAYSPSKGSVTLYSVGVDYKLAPGFVPYAEYTNFNMKTKAYTGANNKGNVVLLGTKIVF